MLNSVQSSQGYLYLTSKNLKKNYISISPFSFFQFVQKYIILLKILTRLCRTHWWYYACIHRLSCRSLSTIHRHRRGARGKRQGSRVIQWHTFWLVIYNSTTIINSSPDLMHFNWLVDMWTRTFNKNTDSSKTNNTCVLHYWTTQSNNKGPQP